jgi:ribonucleoside-triphosphate reductase
MESCPKCGSHHIDRLQRITGYLVGTTDRWNHGKLAELNDRVTHVDGGNQLPLFERL